MSEAHGDAASDVRSFLPRPGEPVEEYAERLRALHRDLTLVLEAVERGLAAAAEPSSVPPPVPDPPADRPFAPAPPADPPARPRGPRVEVVSPPTGEHRRVDEDRRRPEPAAMPVETADPEPRFSPDARRPAAETPPRPAPRFPARPSDLDTSPPAEPEWVDREPGREPPQQFTAPTLPPAGTTISRPLLAAFVAAWLVVVVLLVLVLVLG